MSDQLPPRPEVLDSVSETQLAELEQQASEYDEQQFFALADSYGWDEDTVRRVWLWFDAKQNYPSDGGN